MVGGQDMSTSKQSNDTPGPNLPVLPFKKEENKPKPVRESRKVAMVIPEEPMEVEGCARYLPQAAKKLHGCVNCEWKLHKLCPYGITLNSTRKALDKGICQERINWLLSFSLSYRVRPTFAQWQRDFNRIQAQIVLHKDYIKLIKIEEKLYNLMEEEGNEEDINDTKSEQFVLRKQWLELWKELSKTDESQLNREQPKKVEHSFDNKIPLSEIHRIMRENICVEPIDAEFEEVKVNKSEEVKSDD